MEYRAMYKCRLCNKEFGYVGTTNEKLVMDCITAMINGTKTTQILEPKQFDFHCCEDGSFGFADFKGWKVIGKEIENE